MLTAKGQQFLGALIMGQNEGTSDRPHYVMDVCGWIRKGDKSDKRVIGLCWEVMFQGAVVAVARGALSDLNCFQIQLQVTLQV